MEISFKSTSLAKLCNEEARLKKQLGAQRAKHVKNRTAVLRASTCLADVPNQPPERCHMLSGDYVGCFAVDLGHPYRLVFTPADEPVPRKPDGGLDLRKITKITILEIVDYH